MGDLFFADVTYTDPQSSCDVWGNTTNNIIEGVMRSKEGDDLFKFSRG